MEDLTKIISLHSILDVTEEDTIKCVSFKVKGFEVICFSSFADENDHFNFWELMPNQLSACFLSTTSFQGRDYELVEWIKKEMTSFFEKINTSLAKGDIEGWEEYFD